MSQFLTASLIAASLVVTLGGQSVSVNKTDAPNGHWTLRLAPPTETGAAKVLAHVALRTPGLNTLYVPFEKFGGLTPEQVASANGNAQFVLREDAGTIRFDGTFSGGRGTGTFDFVPSRAFADELERRGMQRPTLDQQFEMARHEIGFDLLNALAANGYAEPTTRAMLEAGINGVDADYVKDMANLGYKMQTLSSLLRLRVNGVNPQFIREVAAVGYTGLTTEQLLSMKVEDVNAQFIRRMNERAGKQLSVETLVRLRLQGEH